MYRVLLSNSYKAIQSLLLLMSKENIAVVGLGYVGLPLAVRAAEKHTVFGFDINSARIEELKNNIDRTNEVSSQRLAKTLIKFSDDPQIIGEVDAGIIVAAIPTPVNPDHTPNITPLVEASKTIGKYLTRHSTVVFESTVYAGATEEICVPEIERISGMKAGEDFYVGYSPERINPGDKVRTVENIAKVVGANDPVTLKRLADFYKTITNEVHTTSSIKSAELAKLIENSQRDAEIAFFNELKKYCDVKDIDIYEVIAAAGTKWNFNVYKPGLVGGHCIGVDPYYFKFDAERNGLRPELVGAARRINDTMHVYEVNLFAQHVNEQNKHLNDAKVALLGAAFKPNVPDVRNSKTEDVAAELKSKWKSQIYICDPLIDDSHVFGYENIGLERLAEMDHNILIQNHDVFKQQDIPNLYRMLQEK